MWSVKRGDHHPSFPRKRESMKQPIDNGKTASCLHLG